MVVTLDHLAACFEGIYPSAIATQSADGTPNISYLSHVWRIDAHHIALSNQFFAKTAANIRSNPRATVLLVDPHSGVQYHVAVIWQRSADHGPLFKQMTADLNATSAQIGMSDVMRLRSVDIFRVENITMVAASDHLPASSQPLLDAAAIASTTRAIGDINDPSQLLTTLLDSVREFGFDHAILLLSDTGQETLTTVAAIGYGPGHVGAEVPFGIGLIGGAARSSQPIRINDVSRLRRMGGAVIHSSHPEDLHARQIAMPGLSDSLSQIAVPMIVHGKVRGVLFVESAGRLAFDRSAVAGLEIIASYGAAILALNQHAEDIVAAAVTQVPAPAAPFERDKIAYLHHATDNSVFIDHAYVIKGLAGRLLTYMVDQYDSDGRREFTNRELRLAMADGLPDFKDNLETRLLLLRRRLEELVLPIRLVRVERGRLRLEVSGRIEICPRA
ncbi:GAF domain-containing protein [Tardiphaga alba]|uniref:GAF domain-containing protein n=1 Tax=Tardiphaga alba TaxID=340268 RepID=A0ABX8A636_9BRAD|nr:GAF domain-containing protein [Tardiphaga alba]QUS38501.1 GAF domain-containing protein [Tardiphaga alba]